MMKNNGDGYFSKIKNNINPLKLKFFKELIQK